MNGHHLILGDLVDFLSGRTIKDTHDERYRQKIARFLVENKGYHKGEIEAGRELYIKADDKCAMIKIDFLITVDKKTAMIIKYGPGSLVTRHRPALAAGRLLTGYQIPIVVVTNGENADILDGHTGKTLYSDLQEIPGREDLINQLEQFPFSPIPNERAEWESRIVYAFEVDGSCPCDDTICRL
jgi:hypothetical protein